MPAITRPIFSGSSRCLRVLCRAITSPCPSHVVRHASGTNSPPGDQPTGVDVAEDAQGAMSRRLEQMSEENIESGGRSAQRAVEEAGFSHELKRRLEEKIASATFRSENASAFAETSLPASASKHIRETAAATPWMGSESLEDASLRMLTDSHKPMRAPRRPPTAIAALPSKVDTGRPSSKGHVGARIAHAKEKTSAYAFAKDSGLSEEEREKFRAQMKQRFQPGARSIPATIQGLESLSNKRIEDAIARGQFKNLPRGQKIERDHNANSPFINTTEYFMNKMIQRQEIVPPWIEKQQEVVSTANRFRGRLRADWKRHVARTIASRGGSLESQMKLADAYALAESIDNPRRRKVEVVNTVDQSGHMSQIKLTGEIKVEEPKDDATVMEEEIKIMEQTFNDDGTLKSTAEQVIVTAEHPQRNRSFPEMSQRPTVAPFRDAQWEETERSYHQVAVDNLNSLTRSYNLMAPNLAKKPYFSLERELKSCFADVAPEVASAIRERALAPKVKGIEVIGHKPGSVFEKFAIDRAGHVYDEQRPQYGFREFWRDLFSSKKDQR